MLCFEKLTGEQENTIKIFHFVVVNLKLLIKQRYERCCGSDTGLFGHSNHPKWGNYIENFVIYRMRGLRVGFPNLPTLK